MDRDDTPLDEPVLTRAGKRMLQEKAETLRSALTGLTEALKDPDRDGRVDEEFINTEEALGRIETILASSKTTDQVMADPTVVEIGDWITVRFADGTTERFLIVMPAEAPLDVERISSESPLSRAVLGRRVGDTVEVDAPIGRYACRIISTEREGVAVTSERTRRRSRAAG